MEQATEEWRGQILGPLLGFLHLRAPNQVTGYLCSLFFSEGNRENVIKAIGSMKHWQTDWRRNISEVEEENFRRLLQRFNVIGRVIASDSLIQV